MEFVIIIFDRVFGFLDGGGFGECVETFFEGYGEEGAFVDVRVQLGHCVGGMGGCREKHMS
jgi:hypothetical protein